MNRTCDFCATPIHPAVTSRFCDDTCAYHFLLEAGKSMIPGVLCTDCKFCVEVKYGDACNQEVEVDNSLDLPEGFGCTLGERKQ
jgi:hypothetical protein